MDAFCLNIISFTENTPPSVSRAEHHVLLHALWKIINSYILFLEATLFLLFPQIETRPKPPGKCLRQVTMSFLIPLSVLRQAMWEISDASLEPPRSRYRPQIIIISPVKILKQKTKLKIFLNFFTAKLGLFHQGLHTECCLSPNSLEVLENLESLIAGSP